MSKVARGAVRIVSLAILLALAGIIPSGNTAGAQERRGPMLPVCGIVYPGGYDLNTVGTVEGELQAIEVPDDGPVRLVVSADRERWVVLASPVWFWKMADIQLNRGDRVAVRGSKTLGADGVLYLIAREIGPAAGETAVAFRDRLGSPLWRDVGGAGRMPGGGHGAEGGAGTGRGFRGGRGRR
jgi:hypothetical protein